tara:strand:- start:90 stop:326 length:237 start_codon:yes stop_codon:yes gene_type:complete
MSSATAAVLTPGQRFTESMSEILVEDPPGPPIPLEFEGTVIFTKRLEYPPERRRVEQRFPSEVLYTISEDPSASISST